MYILVCAYPFEKNPLMPVGLMEQKKGKLRIKDLALYMENNYEGLKLLIDKVDRKIEDFNNKKAVEYLQTESHYFEKIKSLFSK